MTSVGRWRLPPGQRFFSYARAEARDGKTELAARNGEVEPKLESMIGDVKATFEKKLLQTQAIMLGGVDGRKGPKRAGGNQRENGQDSHMRQIGRKRLSWRPWFEQQLFANRREKIGRALS